MKILKNITSISKAKKAFVCALSAAFAISAAAGVATLAGGDIANAMLNTNIASTITSGGLWNVDDQKFNAQPVKDLVKQLTGKPNGTLADLEQALSESEKGTLTATQIAANNGGKDVVLDSGSNGIQKFTPTYVSRLESGEIIVTLWYAYSQLKVPYSAGWYSTDASFEFPANMYSSSYIRSFLNGTPYAAAEGATPKTTAILVNDQSQISLDYSGTVWDKDYKAFVSDGFSQFIVQPKFVPWQNTGLGEKTDFGWSWSHDAPNTQLNSDGLSFINDYSDKGEKGVYYDSWGNDYFWLPAMVETGYKQSDKKWVGLWDTTDSQRLNYNGEYTDSGTGPVAIGAYWLRSVSTGGSSANIHIIRNDNNGSNTTPSNLCSVRPAFHLNLTKVLASLGDNQDNSDLQDEWNRTVEKSLSTGRQQTFTLKRNWIADASDDETLSTSFGDGVGFDSGRLCVPQGANIKLNLNGYKIDRNLGKSVDYGNAIYVQDNATFILEDTSSAQTGMISGGFATMNIGGGIYSRGNLIINSGTICNNKAAGGGGGGVMSWDNLIINGGTICNNFGGFVVGGIGGGVVAKYDFEMNGGIVCDNTSSQGGGGIYISGDSNIVINGGEITGNHTIKGGGAGLHVGVDSTANIYGGKIIGNFNGLASGGGIYVNSGKINLYGGEIADNYAKESGGGIFTTNSTVNIYDEKVNDNESQRGGGVYFNQSSKINIYGGEIDGNKSALYGGGIYVYDSTFTLHNGVISNNVSHDGGGIYASAAPTSFGYVIMNGGRIINNIAGSTGAAISFDRVKVTINGGLITGNDGQGGAALNNNEESTLTINGGQIYGNINSKRNATSGKISNVGLMKNSKITIGKRLPDNTKIGVHFTAGETGVVTAGYTTQGNAQADYNKYFFADSLINDLAIVSGEINIIARQHAARTDVVWRISANGGTPANRPANETYYSMEYNPDAYYTIDRVNMTEGISSIYNQNGIPVSNPVSQVGVYKFTAKNPEKYNNPVYTFEITPRSFNGNKLAVEVVEKNLIYNGGELKPEIKVTYEGFTLTEGTDYTVAYSNNINAGQGTVTVTGKGNYFNSKSVHFDIGKRNLQLRWGDGTVTYDGNSKGVQAFVEGALSGDTVNYGVVYEDRNGGALNGRLVTPVNAGNYRAYAVVYNDNYQFATTATVYKDFVIRPNSVEVVWDENSFTYTGSALAPTGYYLDISGNRVPVTVGVAGVNGATLVGGNSVNAGQYLATATFADGNYAPALDTATLGYRITPAGLNVNNGTLNLTYNGEGQSLTLTVSTSVTQGTIPQVSDLIITYYPVLEGGALGEALAGEPVAAGRYCAAVSVNNDNFTTNETKFYFDINKADMSLTESGAAAGTAITLTYTGNGVALEFAATGVKSENLDITVQYSSNGVNYGDELPVNAGLYTVKITENSGNYAEKIINITVQKKTVTVEWRQDDYAAADGTTFVWAYDGKKHAPLFETDDSTVKLVVNGAADNGTYTVTAAFANSEYSKNYQLVNATAACRVDNSVITEVLWYQYGAQTALGADEVPEIEEISVYGSNGPRLSAYGVVSVAGAAKSSQIKLDVEYTLENGNLASFAGMWSQGVYVARASLTGVGALCELPSDVTADKNFSVVAQKHDTETVAGIVWAVEENGAFVPAAGYNFVYTGRPQSPVALMPNDAAVEIDLSDPATYTVLETGGRYTNAGTYSAFIRPGNYNVAPEDASFTYTIAPKAIEVGWSGDTLSGGSFEWTFDGAEHGPVAAAKNVTGVTGEILITVEKEVNAGTYTAVAKVNGNFTITESDDSSATQEYTIKKRVINPLMVEWSAEDADDRDGYFVWTHDGASHAPAATLTVDGVKLNIKVTGATAEIGSHYAYAALDENDFANANYSLTGASKRFDIVRNTITQVLWRDNEFTYDGAEHKPTAYYVNDDGEEVGLEVFGARTDAGRYMAYVESDSLVLSGSTCEFTILPKKIAVEWTVTALVYNGQMQKPVATVKDVRGEGTEITLQEGVDYTVTGYKNAGSHVAVITFINGNYTYEEKTDTCAFEIAQKKVTVYWQGVDGAMVWSYDGEEHAPEAQAEQNDVVKGESITITVLGAESRVGEYVAYAVTDDDNYYLANADGNAAERTYRVKPYAITLEWHGNADNDGKFEWDYKGTESFAPTATYTNWEKDEQGEYIVHELTVENGGIMGAQTDASEQAYTATAMLPENCEFSGGNTKEFKINKWTIQQVDWSADENAEEILDEDGVTVVGYRWTFDGEMHGPSAKVHATGASLVVTGEARGAGKYVAVAKLSNPENYAFSDDTASQQIEFEILPKEVDIEWFGVGDVSESDENASFDWAYTGNPICPVPKFESVDGEMITVPVSGAAITASTGEYYANAIDVFNDYNFSASSTMKAFTIHKKDITVSWTGSVAGVDGVYTYEFNGTAQQPFAQADVDGVKFTYSITDADGKAVNTVISVGTYTVTATPMDGNYNSGGEMSVTVVIEPKSVEVVWGETTLTYNGQNIAPKAWFIDASGLAVELVVTVEGDHSAAGTYSAVPSLASGIKDYVLKSSDAQEYEIVKYTVDKVEWDFENEEWKQVTQVTPPEVTPDPDEGEDNPVTGE